MSVTLCHERHMNGPTTAKPIRFALALLICLICLCVTVKVLGVSFSFWDLTNASSPVNAGQPVSFAIASPGLVSPVVFAPSPYYWFDLFDHEIWPPRTFFHPPNLHA